ncbi:MAG: DUF1835 domain-containing protein [Bacteroidota bacterium]
MLHSFHILNGDALQRQLPHSLPGEQIIVRECLVDGNVEGDTLEVLFKNRATYLADTYDRGDEADYYKNVAAEFEKIVAIPDGSQVFLWFEEDVFCQVNLWFVSTLLRNPTLKANLVRPLVGYEYGFGGMRPSELVEAFENKISLTRSDLDTFARLWKFYQNHQFQEMEKIGRIFKEKFPFLLPAIQANNERFPKDNASRPARAILKIMDEFRTEDFSIIFREFTKREAIYGFGDLQVKRIHEKILYDKNEK